MQPFRISDTLLLHRLSFDVSWGIYGIKTVLNIKLTAKNAD